MSINRAPFGSAELYTLTNRRGSIVKITTFGGRITEILVPDKQGKLANVNLGHATLEPYQRPKEPYLGALIGRVANRIGGATFEFDGKQHALPQNDKSNSLHGGDVGWDKVFWKAQASDTPAGVVLKLTHTSPDGDQGYSGTVEAEVTYTWRHDVDELRLDFAATTDKSTPINMCNHAYFNLAGAGTGDILQHVVTIHAKRYTPLNDELIPTGEIASVNGTALDFTTPHTIGERIDQTGAPDPGGYDLNYVLDQPGGATPVAIVHEPISGRLMEVFTDQPGIQLYSGNFLDGSVVGLGGAYRKHYGFCLETQHFPDSVNKPNFPKCFIHPGKPYKQFAAYRFSVK